MAIAVNARGADGGGHGMADGGGAGGDGGGGAAGGGGAGPLQHAYQGVDRHAAHAVSVKLMPDAVAINASARSSSALLSEQSGRRPSHPRARSTPPSSSPTST